MRTIAATNATKSAVSPAARPRIRVMAW